ncbi:MAG: hypothetical protein ACK52I_03220 [Pseudomonadota bacterium]|jgi:hypothetical protein
MQNISTKMRVYHRYLGFFLAGIMAMYSISGVVLIFRETDYFKSDKQIEYKVPLNIQINELGEKLGIDDFKIQKEINGIIYFDKGSFDTNTRVAKFTSKELPLFLEKIVNMHKATTSDPLYYLNIFFGVGLLFFVVSSFWMFLPGNKIFKKGLYFTIAGVLLTILIFYW